VGDKVTTSSKLLLLLLLLLLTDLLDFLEDLLALVDLDLDSLDFLARRWCEVASDDSTKAARRPWRTGRLVVTVVDAEVKVVVAARRTTRCFVEKYMMLLLFLEDTVRSRGYRDAICELILFGRYIIYFVGAIQWFSLEHGWNLVFDNLRTNGSVRALVASFPHGSHQRFNNPCPSSSTSSSSFRGSFPPWS
jgi:hypothetical protein